jgi:hypothetical protein
VAAPDVGAHWHRQLAFSRYFITDYLLALIVACHFIGVRTIARCRWSASPCRRRWLATPSASTCCTSR